MIREKSIVAVVGEPIPNSITEGNARRARPPRRGDVGTVIEVNESSDGQQVYAVQVTDKEAYTMWIADFYAEHLKELGSGGV